MLKEQKTEEPAGAGKKEALRVVFDSRLKLEFHGSKVTSDAGLLACRELNAAVHLQSVGGRATEHTAASTSQMGRFETQVLNQPGNLKVLTKLSRKRIDRLLL